MRRPSTLKTVFACLCLWRALPAFAQQQPVSVPGCRLQMVPCGNGPVLCHIFANQATDMPDPRPLNDPTRSDEGPLEASEWASLCYRLYVGIILHADADRVQKDPMAQIYSALETATDSAAPSVFSAIFYNPTDKKRQGAVIYVGATEPLPDANQSDDAYPSAQYVKDNSWAIFQSLASGGQEKVVVDVPANGMAMKVYTPRNIPNPKPGFYAAGTFSLDQQAKLLLDGQLVLLLDAFRRVKN